MKDYLAKQRAEFDLISADHIADLNHIADLIREQLNDSGHASVTFICTHNSRRSQFAQVWATIAAHDLGLSDVACFSGGTEVTECNIRTVQALRRAGVPVTTESSRENPKYSIPLANGTTLQCHSKLYDAPPNPTEGYIAVMTCGHADDACPVVQGAAARTVLRFIDPKASDDTPSESATYDERCAQIAREMAYLMMKVAE